MLDAARPDLGAPLGGRTPSRGGVPRRAPQAPGRVRRAADRDQRRRQRVPAGPLPGAALRRPGLLDLGPGATRGPGRAAGAGGRVRRPRRAHLAHRGPQPAAHPPARRPRRRGHRRPAGLDIASLVAPEDKNVEHDVDRDHRRRRVLPDAAGVVRPRPGHGGAHRAAPQGGARLRLRRRTSASSDRSRRPTARSLPATILRHVDTPLDGSAPCVLYAYGAYESVFPDQEWDPAIPSLLDRGVVYVHAHVRGGGEGGRRWWLDGRMEHKQHTFDDHIAVADGLAAAVLVDGGRIATRGLSAGGLLQGRCSPSGPTAGEPGRRGPLRRRPHHDARPDDPAHRQRVGRVGRPEPTRGLRVDGALLALRQPPAARWPPRPARHRRRPRRPGHGLGARQVVGRAPRDRPRVGTPLSVPRRDRRRCHVGPRGASPTSPTRPRSTPGCSTSSASVAE